MINVAPDARRSTRTSTVEQISCQRLSRRVRRMQPAPRPPRRPKFAHLHDQSFTSRTKTVRNAADGAHPYTPRAGRPSRQRWL